MLRMSFPSRRATVEMWHDVTTRRLPARRRVPCEPFWVRSQPQARPGVPRGRSRAGSESHRFGRGCPPAGGHAQGRSPTGRAVSEEKIGHGALFMREPRRAVPVAPPSLCGSVKHSRASAFCTSNPPGPATPGMRTFGFGRVSPGSLTQKWQTGGPEVRRACEIPNPPQRCRRMARVHVPDAAKKTKTRTPVATMTMTIAQFIRNDCIQRKSRHWRLILPRGHARWRIPSAFLDPSNPAICRNVLVRRSTTARDLMYLDRYVTVLIHLRHGSCCAGSGGREPTDASGHLGRRSCNGGRVGGAATDCSPRRIATPSGAARSGACRRPSGGSAADLQSSPPAAGRSR